jgi:branched-chain amino acid transport system permease protein
MSGYLGAELAVLCLAIITAYGVYLPVAAGQLSLGGAGFQAVGAYAAAMLNARAGWPPALCIASGAIIGAALGGVIAFPILRTRGAYMVLATIAFSEVVAGIILASPSLGGATGIPVPDYVGLGPIVVATICVVLFVALLMSTRLGLSMRAIHDDEAVANLMGVSVRGTQVLAFTLSGALIGLSGALYAHQFGFVDPASFDVIRSVDVLLCVLLGGTQTVWGPLVGTVLFTLLPEVLRAAIPAAAAALQSIFGNAGIGDVSPDASWRFVILGACTVAMMALRPEGIVTRRMVARITAPRRVAVPRPA